MKRLVSLFTCALLLVLLSGGQHLPAAELPDVVRHEAQYLDGTVSITVEWQSANPVTKVRVTAGREQKETPVDEFDNRRNPQGYQGEVTIQVPLYLQSGQGTIPYMIQLEDDTRQKSAPVSGKVTLTNPLAYPYQPPPRDDNWGRENIKTGTMLGPQPPATARAGDMVDKLLVVMDRFDTAPGIDEITVTPHGPDNVSFSTKASDDKGLREVRFRVLDGRGLLVGFQSLTNLGKVWQGTSQTFSLGGGSFRVIAQAIDSAGNTSKEQSATFVLSGEQRELPLQQESQFSTSTTGTSQVPAVYPQQDTPSAFDQPLMLQEQAPYQDQTAPPQTSPYQPSPPAYQSPPSYQTQPTTSQPAAPNQPPPLAPPPMPNDPAMGAPGQQQFR